MTPASCCAWTSCTPSTSGPQVDTAASTTRALGDPTRLRIAAALRSGDELRVCDMAWVVGASQALVSHHLRLLHSAGVVTSRREGRMVMYRLSPRGQAVLPVFIDSVPDRV